MFEMKKKRNEEERWREERIERLRVREIRVRMCDVCDQHAYIPPPNPLYVRLSELTLHHPCKPLDL
jgi:hypothetical protein